MTDRDSEGRRRRDGWVAPLSSVAVGILVLFLLFPASGIDRQPPECYSTLGYVVPCGAGLSVVSAVGGALVAGVVAYAMLRRRKR